MSTKINSDDIIKTIFVVQGLDGQVALPAVHWAGGIVSGSGGDVADLLIAINGACIPQFLTLLNSNVTFKGMLGQRVFPLPVTAREVSVVAEGPGTGGSNSAPQQSAPLLTFETPLAGPAHRGRMFIPFMPGNEINSGTGHLVSLFQGAVQNFGNSLVSLASTGGGTNATAVNLCIYHRESGTFDIVSAAVAQSKVGTQRKRGNYGKANISPI